MDCNRARRPHRHALLRLLLVTCVHEIYASSENSTAKAPVPPEVETTAAARRLALESEADAEAYREFLRHRQKREAQKHAAQQEASAAAAAAAAAAETEAAAAKAAEAESASLLATDKDNAAQIRHLDGRFEQMQQLRSGSGNETPRPEFMRTQQTLSSEVLPPSQWGILNNMVSSDGQLDHMPVAGDVFSY